MASVLLMATCKVTDVAASKVGQMWRKKRAAMKNQEREGIGMQEEVITTPGDTGSIAEGASTDTKDHTLDTATAMTVGALAHDREAPNRAP